MTVFVGLDLAWTPGRESGWCVFELEHERLKLRSLGTRIETPDVFASELKALGPNVVAAIDAPLVVEDGRRAEPQLARVFGRYGAYAYSANRPFLERMNGLAGPELAERLYELGFFLDATALGPRAAGRFALEVYPHPAHVVHFGLDRILRYKRGRVAERRRALEVLQDHLNQLLMRFPVERPDPMLEAVLQAPLDLVRGAALKRIEDQLDALMCALLAVEAWMHGVSPDEVFGDARTGQIAVPGTARDARFAAATSGPAPTSP